MTVLRVDPWDPQRGSSFEALETTDQAIPDVDLEVEGRPWEPVRCQEAVAAPRIAFIDGVRRVDARLFAESDDAIGPALAGSWAVGLALGGASTAIEPRCLGRHLVVGGGLAHEDLHCQIGETTLAYEFLGVAGDTPLDPIQGLQNAMRSAESSLAAEVVDSREFDLVVIDGPLTYFGAESATIGLIKRQARSYLPSGHTAILGELSPGTRTPLFRLGEQRLERYTWYARLAAGRPVDGVLTGIVRLEVAATLGIEAAAGLADIATSTLPRFATRIGRDPRAPQNLYPVAQLEAVLHNRLGHPTLVRRAIEAAIWNRS